MRSKEELKKILLLENFDKYFKTGLCYYFVMLRAFEVITYYELFFLNTEIEGVRGKGDYSFIWKEGLKEPRINWIKNL